MNFKTKNLLFLLACITLVHYKSVAQNDLESWNKLALEYKWNKKLSLGLEQHLRLKTNISEIDKYFTELNGTYKLTDNFALGTGFRYIRENDNQGKIQGYENHFRYNIDAIYGHKINRLSLKYRLRFQNKNELIEDDLTDAKKSIRLKAGLKYNISKWPLDPEFAAEVFNSLDSDNGGLNKYRLTLGTDYKIKNFGEIGVYYRLQSGLNETTSNIRNIIGLNYRYTIKNKKQ